MTVAEARSHENIERIAVALERIGGQLMRIADSLERAHPPLEPMREWKDEVKP